MVINDAVQLTVTVTLYIVSYVFFKINVSFCSVLILLALFATMNTPLNLAAMAIERYVAICNPLRHSQICTVRRTCILIAVIWVAGLAPLLFDWVVFFATESLSFFHSSIFCYRENVFRSPLLYYKRQPFDILYFSFVSLTIIYTYLRIMFAARAATTDRSSAAKARNTILLHGVQLLMCMLTYVTPQIELALLYVFQGRISDSRYVTYLVVYILPRFLSPIIYGLRDKKFRKYLKRYFVCKPQKVQPALTGNSAPIRTGSVSQILIT
ncbi:odorant receptor 131-2-like [Acipenser oxyrinchus oxyrinchus]|uniref:Odorant receptor 131-2-like n=1 Tax=Acipenser oxyrinchus oxyrinchus TaxID=40147 RepID=A0AAD8FVN4_ACIOX|nr:odorant receptor 131-2-like [Acipenser oxyrinchus oxyrinchus]